MSQNIAFGVDPLDPAAVFAATLSVWEECNRQPTLDISEHFNGVDQFMREAMRTASLFESWSCKNVEFAELDDVWPYLLQDKFGPTCLAVLSHPAELIRFSDTDCLRVALRMNLPIKMDGQLPVPVDVRAPNPDPAAEFREFRIQTVRDSKKTGEVIPFTSSDDPFDLTFGPLYYGLYGLDNTGIAEHIGNRKTYFEIVRLVQKIAPGVEFPRVPLPGDKSHSR